MPNPLKDILKAAILGPIGWHDLARATIELASAHRRLGREATSDLLQVPATAETGPTPQYLTTAQARLVSRVSYAIPRMGARVPWRSDCLVQALAAQRWLAGSGIISTINIGARNGAEQNFDAHAWLTVGNTIITGGDITGYVPLIGPRAKALPD